jgi:lycopene cyclase domain-containing protein
VTATYFLLNLVVLIPAAIILIRTKPATRRRIWRLMLILLGMTLVFDNLLIAAGIVSYHPQYLLGLKLGLAPIEDLAYCLAASIIVPLFWERLTRHAHHA